MTVETLGRGWELYRRTATTRSAILLLVANLIPLFGVLLFDWSLITILVLYWLENGIVGIWNVPKIILAQGSATPRLPDMPDSAALAATGSPEAAARLQEQWRQAQAAQAAQLSQSLPSGAPATATRSLTGPSSGLIGPRAAARLAAIPRTGLAIFFAFHYGVFWLVHGIFVFLLPTFGGGFGPSTSQPGSNTCFDATGFPIDCAGGGAFGELALSSVVIGAIALVISHGASFFLNYIGRGEYITATPGGQMASVYGRVVVLHLTIIFGSMVVAFLGAPIGALLVLVVLKTAFDLGLHLRERQRSGPRVPATLA